MLHHLKFLTLAYALLWGYFLMPANLVWAKDKTADPVFTISQPLPLQPETQPITENQSGSAVSSDHMHYEPYNIFPRELDLWNLEGRRFVRSQPVISPDKSEFAYTEVMFVPNIRQTISKLYRVKAPPIPTPPLPHLPSEDANAPPSPTPDPAFYANRFNPDKTVQIRQSLVEVGYNRVKPFDFKTLTVIDWSADGRRLLFKERSGVLHVGLRTTDIFIYDQPRGIVTIYPEVRRVIEYYWANKGNLPHIQELVWDIQPLGWEPQSNNKVLLKAWAYDKKEKKFLGLWCYDVDAERTLMLQLENTAPPVAANGWLGTPEMVPPTPEQ